MFLLALQIGAQITFWTVFTNADIQQYMRLWFAENSE